MSIHSWIAACIAVIALVVPAYAQNAVLKGMILDLQSAPVHNARIVLENFATHHKWKIRTDVQGKFIMRVPLGVYRITVKAKKFASDSDTLAVAQQTEEFSRILSPKNCKHCLLIDANPWRRNFEMAMKKVDVVGYGPMGSGIAQVSAMAGFDTSVLEVEQRVLDKSFAGIEKSLSKYARSTAL